VGKTEEKKNKKKSCNKKPLEGGEKPKQKKFLRKVFHGKVGGLGQAVSG